MELSFEDSLSTCLRACLGGVLLTAVSSGNLYAQTDTGAWAQRPRQSVASEFESKLVRIPARETQQYTDTAILPTCGELRDMSSR